MPDDEPTGVGAVRLHIGHRVAGRGRGNDDTGGGGLVDPGQQFPLEFQPFRGALLDELGLCDGLFHGLGDGEPVL